MVIHESVLKKALAVLLLWSVNIASCNKGPAPVNRASDQTQQTAGSDQITPTIGSGLVSLTTKQLEDLLAPIALYPDALLAQILTASTTPQEVLDGGNWLLQNSQLKGDQLDEAAAKVGLGPSMTVLLHFPQVVDMMCKEMNWTAELGQAFTSNQKAVLDTVQKLRAQAVQVGSLQTTPQQKVEKQEQDGKVVIVIQPSDPKIVYVPQYDPSQVYTPPPQAQSYTSTSQQTSTQASSSGVSTGTAVMTSLMTFGLGMMVGSALSNNNNYYPNWGHGGVYYGPRPYVPAAYVYRPAYTPYYPRAALYRPPPNYQYAYNRPTPYNNNYRYNSNYYSNFNARPTTYAGNNVNTYRGGNNNVSVNNSVNINTNKARIGNQNPAQNQNWNGQGTYAGANRAAGTSPSPTTATRAGVANNTNRLGTSASTGAYNNPNRSNSNSTVATNLRSGTQPGTAATPRNSGSNSRSAGDRGYGGGGATASVPRSSGLGGGGAFAGAQNGRSENAASARGRASTGASPRAGARRR